MTIWKRASLFLIRNKSKTLILLLILTITASFVLAGFSARDAIYRAQVDLRKTIVGYFNIEANAKQNAVQQVNDKIVKAVRKLDGIKAYNGIDVAYMYTKDISLVSGRFSLEDDVKAKMTRVLGNTDSQKNEYFVLQVFHLLEGRHIKPNDTNKAVISDDLAKVNNLELGDWITMLPDTENLTQKQKDKIEEKKLEIVGIFQLKEDHKAKDMNTAECDMDENFIFTDTSFIRTMQGQILDREIREYSKGVTFFVEDVGELEEITRNVKKIAEFDQNQYSIISNSKIYKDMDVPLGRMSRLLMIFVSSIVGISIVMLTLILFMWMRDRIYETGILVSVGINKKQVIGQHILENSIVMLGAFLLAGVIVLIGAEPLGSLFMGVDIRVSVKHFCVAIGMDYLIVIASTVLASIKIYRMQPKEILSMDQ